MLNSVNFESKIIKRTKEIDEKMITKTKENYLTSIPEMERKGDTKA